MFAENVVPIADVSELCLQVQSVRRTGSPFSVGVGVVDWDVYGHIWHLHGCGLKSAIYQRLFK